jgi:hypothetical protein
MDLICESAFIDLRIQIRESEPKRFGFVDLICDLNSKDLTCFHKSNKSL